VGFKTLVFTLDFTRSYFRYLTFKGVFIEGILFFPIFLHFFPMGVRVPVYKGESHFGRLFEGRKWV